METEDLFNISSEMLAAVESAAQAISETSAQEQPVAYGCICCGSGWCTAGIADD